MERARRLKGNGVWNFPLQNLAEFLELLGQFKREFADLHDVRVRRELGRELFGRFDGLFLVHLLSFGLEGMLCFCEVVSEKRTGKKRK